MSFEQNILLNRIVNHLILHSCSLDDVGLFHGKTGVVLFFAHYARYTGIEMYDDFAEKLLEDIANNISKALPINMEFGLCGIGWGINYLIQNGFMKGDPNEILADIDEKIMERDLRRVKDLSLETGLMGIYYYIQSRIEFSVCNGKDVPFDHSYLSEWRDVAGKMNVCDSLNILSLISEKIEPKDFSTWDLGLVNGCAGYGLKTMMR